jgi:glycosyltransferase involved in cell wall biosynthesis
LTALSPSALTRVRRLGVRDDAERFLQIADVFLFPSRREGFGTAIIEAMASGVPCVVAALPGITDYIFAAAVERPSAARGAVPDGLVVPQEDPGALAEAALELLSGPERAAAIGAAGRARVREQFDIERIAEQYLSWYAALLRGSGSGARP